ncbi:hypothetical protein ES754_01730 [Psychrobacter frigidicola]|uniref:Uncharacterized protein n=1 Tax=Psychrobacter frigidicola TaxID=45611 RepID=A0A5C7A2E6_9GAMM|nr:hypothetical protein [Psychrobacter frigidicola]TXD97727.1 hypothetical protein ES754_01730 [Psychrobacter frigidicola]
MQYTAIIKDGGLFIPNVFADLNNGNDGGAHIVQVTVDIAAVRQQLSASTEPTQETLKTTAPKETKKPVKKQPKKEAPKAAENLDLGTQRKGAIDELEALNDSELSEIFKAYMNDGQAPTQISLENL